MKSVAMRFLPEENQAPVVVASGEGILGEKILTIAKKNQIPVVKDKNLAETLSYLPIDKEIPENLYKAVSAIFRFIIELERENLR
ncbi:MAG: EscU/YscU/HrcU family type III secretion system export apparatus switch protein [Leptospiraceae bacterium]|nr:EscU/YscU/HrcU family type III secretion system export apparatus switch protein [Leptospiraceae bacterium]MCK6379827.1 EscU/YscU/HrcU family type III secretion system export apparatus switch protein [Leptospiraceae bacterium]NUM40981.1 EscU/YscU/HrcU family type III secretion system export apparatus switch protein [Leptospiraceae bacterium]